MHKKSTTREKVQQAADDLLAKGQRPTQQAIRDMIGTGSITTINLALNEWWAHLSKRINRQSEHPTLPEPVIGAASKLWDQALAYAEHALAKERLLQSQKTKEEVAINQEQLSQMQADLFKQQQQNNRLLESNEKLLEEKGEFAHRMSEIESLLIQETAKANELQRVNKQQHLMLSSKEVSQMNEPRSDELFQAKIDLKVNDAIIDNLKKALLEKENQCNDLQQQFFSKEKAHIKQVHRLELVITQQDTKYNDVKEQLESYLLPPR